MDKKERLGYNYQTDSIDVRLGEQSGHTSKRYADVLVKRRFTE